MRIPLIIIIQKALISISLDRIDFELCLTKNLSSNAPMIKCGKFFGHKTLE